MKTHELKIAPEFFDAVVRGDKTFEVRRDDRGFKVGDLLHLQEHDPDTHKWTGRACIRRVSYILPGGAYGIDKAFVVLALAEVYR